MPPKSPRKRVPAQSRWTREEYLTDSLAGYLRTAESAEEAGYWNASVDARRAADKVRAELDLLRDTRATSAAPETLAAHRRELIAVVRRLRVGAEGVGSYIAATKLVDREGDLIAAAEHAAKAAETDALAAVPDADLDAEIVALVDEVLAELPPEALDRLAVVLADRLER